MLDLCFLEDLVYAWWYHGFVGAFSVASQGVALGVCLMLATGSGMLVVGPCLIEESNLPWLWFLKGFSPVAILKNAAQVTRYSDQNQQQSSKIYSKTCKSLRSNCNLVISFYKAQLQER